MSSHMSAEEYIAAMHQENQTFRAENERLNRVNEAWYIEVERLKARNVKLEKVAEAAHMGLTEAVRDCRYHDEYGEGKGLYKMVTPCGKCRYWEAKHLCGIRRALEAFDSSEVNCEVSHDPILSRTDTVNPDPCGLGIASAS